MELHLNRYLTMMLALLNARSYSRGCMAAISQHLSPLVSLAPNARLQPRAKRAGCMPWLAPSSLPLRWVSAGVEHGQHHYYVVLDGEVHGIGKAANQSSADP